MFRTQNERLITKSIYLSPTQKSHLHNVGKILNKDFRETELTVIRQWERECGRNLQWRRWFEKQGDLGE